VPLLHAPERHRPLCGRILLVCRYRLFPHVSSSWETGYEVNERVGRMGGPGLASVGRTSGLPVHQQF
jgi:hypothetical protein